ncbi:hypothetical protein ACFU44_13905 [Nocardia rhizosphaerihabitans]|uniref:hypothetical protein n=1 Tax=Nocardia rhizosphaerihabitans TaxID=1691570 RepID=UPI00366B4D85
MSEQIVVNECGEFEEGCICGSADGQNFEPVVEVDGVWKLGGEGQTLTWACHNCYRVYRADGTVIANTRLEFHKLSTAPFTKFEVRA